MTNENSNRYIEINGEKIPVTEEVYRAYKRPEWAESNRRKRSKRCLLPNGHRCWEDCSMCSYFKNGGDLSFDGLQDEYGYDVVSDENIEDDYEKKILLAELHKLLDGLSHIDRQIIDLYGEGLSQRSIADRLGFKNHKSVSKRFAKILANLRDKLKDYR